MQKENIEIEVIEMEVEGAVKEDKNSALLQ